MNSSYSSLLHHVVTRGMHARHQTYLVLYRKVKRSFLEREESAIMVPRALREHDNAQLLVFDLQSHSHQVQDAQVIALLHSKTIDIAKYERKAVKMT
jgi:hypothetical protein